MNKVLLSVFAAAQLLALSAHAVSDESLNARADYVAAKGKNPQNIANLRVTIRKISGMDEEVVCENQTAKIKVINERMDEAVLAPARITCESTLDNRPVTVVVKTQIRITKESVLKSGKGQQKMVMVYLTVARPEDVSSDLNSDPEPVRNDLTQLNMVYVDTNNKTLLVPVGMNALTSTDMKAENFMATVEVLDNPTL